MSLHSARRARHQLRQRKLSAYGYRSYTDYLRSAHWRATRTRYWISDQPKDCICGERDGLELHHMTYERVCEEELSDLTLLCSNCHAMIHVLERRGEIGLDFSGFVSEQRAKRYAAARRPPDLPPSRDELLRAEEQVFLRSVLRRWVIASKLGINVDSDINVILRRFRAIQQKLGIEPCHPTSAVQPSSSLAASSPQQGS